MNSPAKVKVPPASNKASASQPPPTAIPLLPKARLSLPLLHFLAALSKLRAPHKLRNSKNKLSSKPFKTSSRRNRKISSLLGFQREAAETESQAVGIAPEVERGIIGGEVGVEVEAERGTEIERGGEEGVGVGVGTADRREEVAVGVGVRRRESGGSRRRTGVMM